MVLKLPSLTPEELPAKAMAPYVIGHDIGEQGLNLWKTNYHHMGYMRECLQLKGNKEYYYGINKLVFCIIRCAHNICTQVLYVKNAIKWRITAQCVYKDL